MPVMIDVTLVCDICKKKKSCKFPLIFRRKGGVINEDHPYPQGWGRTYGDKSSVVCSKKCAAEYNKENPPYH